MSDEVRVTVAAICAALGATLGMGVGYMIEGVDPTENQSLAFGARLVFTSAFALLFFRQALRESR